MPTGDAAGRGRPPRAGGYGDLDLLTPGRGRACPARSYPRPEGLRPARLPGWPPGRPGRASWTAAPTAARPAGAPHHPGSACPGHPTGPSRPGHSPARFPDTERLATEGHAGHCLMYYSPVIASARSAPRTEDLIDFCRTTVRRPLSSAVTGQTAGRPTATGAARWHPRLAPAHPQVSAGDRRARAALPATVSAVLGVRIQARYRSRWQIAPVRHLCGTESAHGAPRHHSGTGSRAESAPPRPGRRQDGKRRLETESHW